MKKDWWNQPMSRKNWAAAMGICCGGTMFILAGVLGGFKTVWNAVKKGFNKIKNMVKKKDIFED